MIPGTGRAFLLFKSHPDVEMLGLDREDDKNGHHTLVGYWAGRDGVWVNPQTEAQGQEFQDLGRNIQECLLEGTPSQIEFCLDHVFVPDPGGEFGLFLSRHGLGQAVERCVEVDDPAPQKTSFRGRRNGKNH